MGTPRASGSILTTPRGVSFASAVVDFVLALAKILAGIFCRSQTILADGLHSGSDLVTDLVVLAGLRVSDKPADGSHHYGHRRVGTLIAMSVGLVLASAAAWIAFRAVSGIHDYLNVGAPNGISADLPFWLAIASAPAKELMFRWTRHVGRKTSNVSLMANAWHHRGDAMTSVAAAVGLAGVLFGGPGWWFLDPATALVLSAFLVVVAARIVSDSASELIDRAPDAGVLAGIEDVVSSTEGVKSFHGLRARKTGGKVTMDIHIQVDPDLTVRKGHDIASDVRRRIVDSDSDVVEVIVHVEPKDDPS